MLLRGRSETDELLVMRFLNIRISPFCRNEYKKEMKDMGYFKDQLIPEYRDKDPQKFCGKCNEMISDVVAHKNKGLCDKCNDSND
jgi:formylmethanofuran dehydrogenase subunit E